MFFIIKLAVNFSQSNFVLLGNSCIKSMTKLCRSFQPSLSALGKPDIGPTNNLFHKLG